MTTTSDKPITRLLRLLDKHRKYAWIAVIITSYALLGFFLAPWLVKKYAVETYGEMYAAELSINKVDINPFVLSIRIVELELLDPVGDPLVRAGEIFVNFQLSSLFRWAWTFDEFRITRPELFVARDKSGDLNIAFLTAETAVGEPSGPAPEDTSPMTRMMIFAFAISDGAVNWRDEVPVDLVETRFGPINIEIQELNTLPQRSGHQTVLITTETSGTLSWTGSLELNPLKSAAHASIKGSHFPLASAYIRHESGFDIVDGNVDVELDYTINALADGSLAATVDNFNLAFNDVIVHTFSGAPTADPENADREVLRLPEVRLTGGALRWPEQTVSIESLSIDDTLVSIYRDKDGVFNIDRQSAQAAATSETTPETAPDAAIDSAWQVSLDNFAINHLAVNVVDHSVEPFADVGISDFNMQISNISNNSGARFPSTLSLRVRTGGTLAMDGHLSFWPDIVFDLDLKIDNIALAGAHPYIKPLADLNLDSGAINVTGHVNNSSDEDLLFKGDVEIVDFELSETDEGTRLGSWKRLLADNILFSSANESLEISELRLEQPYGDLVIAEDGSLNLGRVEKEGSSVAQTEPESMQPDSSLAITVGRVVITQGAADFADFSLPLPFAAKIAELEGSMTTISTASNEPSTVEFEGKVDEYGFVHITGFVTPLEVKLNTNMSVVFQNVNMPKFTAYTIPFAGREIANGALDLKLSYQITEGQLVGENAIVLRDLELGEKVEHPGAMSLPLGLAVALLKGPDGKIDIDLPVRGDVNDPDFSYGGIILKALANLIIKIVASPFALLANLVGIEASDLEYISFLDGRSDLTPPEMQKAAKLAEALALRPALVLKVPGVIDRESDGLALQTAQLDAIVKERIAAQGSADDSGDMYADQRQAVLEQLFLKQAVETDLPLALQDLRARFTTQLKTEEGSETRFDELAYANELNRQLVDLQPLTDAELIVLATERKENTRAAILANDESLENRITLGSNQAVEKKSDEKIQLKVTLSVGSGSSGEETDAESEQSD